MKYVEILGHNLKRFFDTIDNPPIKAEITYAGNRYEVWTVEKELFDEMCNMTEEEFFELAGEKAWWRSSSGSNLKNLERGIININNKEMIGWVEKPYGKHVWHGISYQSLTEYLCNFVGASTGKNVCSCAMDLAKYNDMTMGELFEKYEGEYKYGE